MKGFETNKIPVFGIREFLPEQQAEEVVYVNDLKTHLSSHRFINVPHSHQTYITILFTRGKGIHQVDFKSYEVNPGDVFLLSPGQVHSWTLSADTDGFIVFHTEFFYNNLFKDRRIDNFPFFYLSHNHPLIRLKEAPLQGVIRLFKEMYDEYQDQADLRHFKIGSLINVMYIDLARLYTHDVFQTENEAQVRIRKFTKLVDEHYKTLKLPQAYAELMHMSTRHLSRLCNEILGKTTSDIIQQRVLLEAKRLLIHSQDSVSLIAYELGYEDVSYFIRFFRHKAGISPKQFREQKRSSLLE